MSTRAFGSSSRNRGQPARVLLLGGVCLAVLALVLPARGGTITFADGDDRTAPLVLTEDYALVTGAEVHATQSGVVSGSSGIAKQGEGTLVLSGANTYSGGTDVNMGGISLKSQTALGTGLVTMFDGTRLQFDLPGTFAFANDIEIHGVAELRGNQVEHQGAITGDGTLVLNGDFTMSNNVRHTGGTDLVSGSRAVLNSNTSIGTGQVRMANYSYLVVNFGSLTIDNSLDLLSGSAYLETRDPGHFRGVISGAGSMIKIGQSLLTLSGNNTYRGGTNISNGAVRVEHDHALGSGTVYLSQDTSLQYANGVSIDNELSPGTGAALHVDTGTATQTGDIIGPTLAGGYSKTGSGKLVLLGTASYGGNTHIVAGTLEAGAEGVLAVTSLHILQDGARLNLLADQKVGGISGGGTIDLAGNVLTLNANRTTSTYQGTLQGDAESGLVMDGTRFLTLNGDNEGYGGFLRVNSGGARVNGDYGSMRASVSSGSLGGEGRLGDVVVTGGTLVGVDGSRLDMDSLQLGTEATVLAQLGTASQEPLFLVSGDLVLDGQLDVEDVGGFEPGIYRIFSYGGALTDNGLEIGAVPDGYQPGDLQVQTSIGGQVNLLRYTATAGDTLFWDGSDPLHGENGRVDGGDGTWGAGDSFTTADGNTNSTQSPVPGFVVFAGEAGTVNVHFDEGNAQVTGIQFATNGYQIEGDAIELASLNSIVRVGDGTQAGASYVATIDSALVGSGGLVKTELGRLVLNSDANTYSGGTEVRAGTLEVNGRVGDVEIGTNGRLEGTGIVGDTHVAGTLAAGHSMGTLRVDGDLLLAPDSVFELEVDAEGNSDLVEVSGTAQLDGDVLVLASGGDYQAETEYTFLRAEGGIEGRFDDLSSDLAFLVATLDYNANDVRLILSRNGVDFADIANTRNQRAAAGGVETLGPGSTLYDRVLTYGADDAQAAFDELSGEIYASTAGTMLTSNQVLSQSMNDRVAAAFAQLGRSSAPGEATGLNFWSSAAGGIGVLEGNGNAEDTRFSAGNLFVGADAMFNNQWIFGAVAGLGHTGIAVTERSSSATVDNYHLGVYGGGEVENFTVKFGAGVSGHSIDTRRSVTTPGFAEQLFSTRGAATGQFFGELGHKFTLDSGLVLEPFVNLSHASLFLDDFDEKGETAALAGGSTTRSLTQITLGLRGETTFDVGEIQAKASAMVGWRHTLGGVDPTSTHAFSGGGDFTVAGSPIVKDAAVVQAGLDLQLTDALDVGVRYDGQFDANVQQQGIKANLTLQF